MSTPTKQFSSLKPLLIGLVANILLIIGFGGWAVMAQLSGAIIASGQIEVDQNRQIVQHPNDGVVAEILVDEGDTVINGDVLLRLDPRGEKSELSIIQGQLFELMARRGRLIAERDNLDRVTFDPKLIAAAAKDPAIEELKSKLKFKVSSRVAKKRPSHAYAINNSAPWNWTNVPKRRWTDWTAWTYVPLPLALFTD